HKIDIFSPPELMGIGLHHPGSIGGAHPDTVGQIIPLLFVKILEDIQQIAAASKQNIPFINSSVPYDAS
ncbi:hypothetical protein LI129_24360, partial [Erysipelatoclostridium ramosum]|uniref:hypothetical protein n=1 Tax=Thomasclavelia ramosa TaxID=1547 RepID=UPI001D0946A6